VSEGSSNNRPTVLSVDLDAVVRNAHALSRHAGGRPMLAVVKSNAYGMGAIPVAKALSDQAAAWLGVALVEEGIQLRRAGINSPVLMVGPAGPEQASDLLSNDITPAIYSLTFLKALEHACTKAGRGADVHVKLDSGMGRLGFRPEEVPGLLKALSGSPHLTVRGIFSNLATADDPRSPQTGEQLDVFMEQVEVIRRAGHEPQWVHLANSSALLAHPATHLSLCRPGLALYGIKPSPSLPGEDLQPAVSLKTVVLQIKDVPAGTPIGYSATYRASNRMTVGILPIGYADGLPRCLQERGSVLVDGVRRPIIGRVSMDLTAVDLSGEKPVKEGDAVTLWGRDGQDSLTPWDWALWSGTIPYEVMTGVGCRVARRYTLAGRTWIEQPLAH
jgi:alanine racemase